MNVAIQIISIVNWSFSYSDICQAFFVFNGHHMIHTGWIYYLDCHPPTLFRGVWWSDIHVDAFIYLYNLFSAKRPTEPLKRCMESIVVPVFCLAQCQASEDQAPKLQKVSGWEWEGEGCNIAWFIYTSLYFFLESCFIHSYLFINQTFPFYTYLRWYYATFKVGIFQ